MRFYFFFKIKFPLFSKHAFKISNGEFSFDKFSIINLRLFKLLLSQIIESSVDFTHYFQIHEINMALLMFVDNYNIDYLAN
jgi:hypothetical protein